MKAPVSLPQSKAIRYLRTFLMASVLAFCSAAAVAISLGGSTWVRMESHELTRSVDLSPRFFLEVGGVASQGRAKCTGCTVQSVTYMPTASDGQRLTVTVKMTDGTVNIARVKAYDWELKPAFLMAKSGYGSAVTLFGSLKDPTKDVGGHVVNYHPALDNTVMGLRLLQADLLLIDEDAADLFKDDHGQYILAPGESAPDLAENTKRWNAVNSVLRNAPDSFQSYVVGDIGRTVSFHVEGGEVVFTATPYWYAWTQDTNSPSYQQFDQLRSKLFEEIFNDEEQSASDAKIKSLATKLEAAQAKIPAKHLARLSGDLSAAIRNNQGVNPAVYAALTKFITLTALARELSADNTSGFEAALTDLSASKDVPRTITPTVKKSPFDDD